MDVRPGMPGNIALQTKESEPINDCNCFNVIFVCCSASSTFCIMALIFVSGIDTTCLTESISKPRLTNFEVDSTDFAVANDTPKFLQI